MGEQIIGKYSYDKFLGEGSFGKVYQGRNLQTGEIVAVKCMDMNKLSDPFMLNALNTEIQVQMSLKSQNIVRLYDVISTPQITYIMLELCPNGDLDKFIEQNGGMVTENVAIEVLKQLMAGFQEMASHNVIHRDIKPANCLVKDKVFKVADFGFACEADLLGKTLIKECVGTPLFMAPQLLDNHPYTSKSDIWSIGMMFYMMIFGGTPWPCRDRNSFLDNMKRYPLKFPYDKPIQQDTKDFIQRCLMVNEDDRIGWQEIFHHPLLVDNHELKQIQQHSVQLDDISKQILFNLQQLMHNKNLDPAQFYNSFDLNHGGYLDQNEFYVMIRTVDPQITFGECSRIFQQIGNTQLNGALTMTEFLNIIQQFDFSDINDRGSRFIHDLSEIIRTNNINLYQFFRQFDLDNSNMIDLREFSNMMQQVAPGFTPKEIEIIFNKFDQNGDKQINFNEFQARLVQGSKPQGYQESWVKVKNQVKQSLIQKNFNFSQIFSFFDLNADGFLNDQEFARLVIYVDQYIHQDEIRELFKQINKNLISLNDLYTLFA